MWNEIISEVEAARATFVSQNLLNLCAHQNLNIFFDGPPEIARY